VRAKVLKISCHVQLTMVMRLTDLIVKLGSECVRLHQWTGAPAPAPSVPAPPSGSRTNSALALEAEKYYVERGLQVFGKVGAPNYHGVPQMCRKWELAVEDMVKHPPLEGDLPASVMPLYKQLCAVLRDSAPVCAWPLHHAFPSYHCLLDRHGMACMLHSCTVGRCMRVRTCNGLPSSALVVF